MASSPGQPHEFRTAVESFSATIKIKQHREGKRANASGYFDDPMEVMDAQLLEIVISSDTLQGLKGKIHAHVDLTEEH